MKMLEVRSYRLPPDHIRGFTIFNYGDNAPDWQLVIFLGRDEDAIKIRYDSKDMAIQGRDKLQKDWEKAMAERDQMMREFLKLLRPNVS